MLRERINYSVSAIARGTPRTPLQLVEDPSMFKEAVCAQSFNQLQYVKYEGNDVHQLKMRFFECTNETYIDIVVHYDLGPTKAPCLPLKPPYLPLKFKIYKKRLLMLSLVARPPEKAQRGVKQLELTSGVVVTQALAAAAEKQNAQQQAFEQKFASELEAMRKQVSRHEQALAPNLALMARAKNLEASPNALLMYNDITRELDIKFLSFRILSNTTFKREDETWGRYVGVGVSFIGNYSLHHLINPS